MTVISASGNGKRNSNAGNVLRYSVTLLCQVRARLSALFILLFIQIPVERSPGLPALRVWWDGNLICLTQSGLVFMILELDPLTQEALMSTAAAFLNLYRQSVPFPLSFTVYPIYFLPPAWVLISLFLRTFGVHSHCFFRVRGYVFGRTQLSCGSAVAANSIFSCLKSLSGKTKQKSTKETTGVGFLSGCSRFHSEPGIFKREVL